MKPIQSTTLNVAAILIGSLVVGASIASNPATAQSVSAMVQEFTNTVCSKSVPCKKYTNNGTGAGVEGVGGNGNGVVAQSTNGDATLSTSTDGNGVRAQSTNANGIVSSSTNGNGILVQSINANAIYALSTYGVGIQVNSLNNIGTWSGTSNNSSLGDARSGVLGHDDSIDGGRLNMGVSGTSINGFGISGSSSNYVGVDAVGGEDLDGGFTGVPALSVVGGSGSPSFLIFACANPADNPCSSASQSFRFAVDNGGNIQITGLIYTAGGCAFGCSRGRNGVSHRVTSYAPSQTVPSIDDFGEAQLVNGRAVVQLSADFANVVDRRADYLVFITPEGDSRGLYVTDKSRASFTVRENEDGRSNLAFSYRIVAKPFGVDKPRLPLKAIGASRPASAIRRSR